MAKQRRGGLLDYASKSQNMKKFKNSSQWEIIMVKRIYTIFVIFSEESLDLMKTVLPWQNYSISLELW